MLTHFLNYDLQTIFVILIQVSVMKVYLDFPVVFYTALYVSFSPLSKEDTSCCISRKELPSFPFLVH